MGNLFYVQTVGERKRLRNLQGIPNVVRAVLVEKVRQWTEMMRDEVLSNIRNRLDRKTGKLEASIRMEIVENGLLVEGRVYSVGVPYARAQEEGASIPPHIIRPKNAKILAFYAATGNKVFATRVFHPGGMIPGQHFMADARRAISPKVTGGLRYYLSDEFRKRVR